jgi:hypothetical protein
VGVACILIGTAVDSLFLPHASLWTDEATQMSGLSLSPTEVTQWLGGKVDHDFGVSPDRMPPLSYWAGWAWSGVFGLSERPMRWFGVACIALATGLVFVAASKAWGITGGTVAALLLATSPNVIVQAVEIRAYPLLILESAGIFTCFVGYSAGPAALNRRWLAGMWACGIAAMYTHFFGLVVLGGALVASFLVARFRGDKIVPVVIAGAMAAFAALGVGPFAFASAAISQAGVGPAEGKMADLIRLGYRLFSHPSTAVNPVAVGLSAIGFALTVACSLFRKTCSEWASVGLWLALGSGGAVVALAHMSQSCFQAASPNYNVWMLPPLVLLMASGMAANARPVRVAALAGVVLVLVANAYAIGQLAVRGDAFAHSPHRHIADLIRRYGPRDVAVVHDGSASQAWHIYTPIRYEFGGRIRQFSDVSSDWGSEALRVVDYPSGEAKLDPRDLPFRTLLVVRSTQQSAKSVASMIHRGVAPLGDGRVAQTLLASPAWARVEQETYFAFVAADVDVFQKVDRR